MSLITLPFAGVLSKEDVKAVVQEEVVKGVATAITADLAGVSADIAKVSLEVGSISDTVRGLSAEVRTVGDQVRPLTRGLDAVAVRAIKGETDIVDLRKELSVLTGSARELSAQVQPLPQRLEEVTQKANTGAGQIFDLQTTVGSLSKSVLRVSDLLLPMTPKLDAVQQKTDTGAIDIAALRRDLTALSGNVQTVSGLVQPLPLKLTEVTKQATDGAAEITAIKGELTVFLGNFQALSRQVQPLPASMLRVEQKADTSTSDIGALRTTLEPLPAALGLVKRDTDAATTAITVIRTTLDPLPAALGLVKRDTDAATTAITAIRGEAERLSKDFQMVSDEVLLRLTPNLAAVVQKADKAALDITALQAEVARIKSSIMYPPRLLSTYCVGMKTGNRWTFLDFMKIGEIYWLTPVYWFDLRGATTWQTGYYESDKTTPGVIGYDQLYSGSITDWLNTPPPKGQGCLTIVNATHSSAVNPAVRPFFFLPLAQCWGGSVRGYLEVSFWIALPPADAPDTQTNPYIKVALFHGYPGRTSTGGGPVIVDPNKAPGKLAKEILGGQSETATFGYYKLGIQKLNGNMMVSPFQRFKIAISYDRKAPRNPGAIDNQYFGAIWTCDNRLTITDLEISLTASAATPTITEGWTGSVPDSLNTPA